MTQPRTSDSEPKDRPPRSGHSPRVMLIGLAIGAGLGLLVHPLSRVPASAPGSPPPANDLNSNGLHDLLDWFTLNITDSIGQIFLRLMFMVVVPLVVSALALAVINLGSLRDLGRVGLRTLLYTGIFSSVAVILGVGLVNLLQPGNALQPESRQRLQSQYQVAGPAGGTAAPAVPKEANDAVSNARKAKSLRDLVLDIIPRNPLQEMVGALDGTSPGNGMLSVMFFALMFGVAISMSGPVCQPLVDVLEAVYAACMTVIAIAMKLAPLGAGCLVFSVTARLGWDIVQTLAWFLITVVGGLAIHQFIVMGLVVRIASGRSPASFFRDVSEAMLTAFGTASSNATLPTSIQVAHDTLRLPPKIANFVLTVGATGNQNGTALFEGVVVLFLAQLFDVSLTFGQQIQVVLMSILAGVGTAGVPGGSLPIIVLLLESVGVPGASIGIILGVDRFLDMCRTCVNVTGDLAVATCVTGRSRPEPEILIADSSSSPAGAGSPLAASTSSPSFTTENSNS